MQSEDQAEGYEVHKDVHGPHGARESVAQMSMVILIATFTALVRKWGRLNLISPVTEFFRSLLNKNHQIRSSTNRILCHPLEQLGPI